MARPLPDLDLRRSSVGHLMPARYNAIAQLRAHNRAPVDGKILKSPTGYILAAAEVPRQNDYIFLSEDLLAGKPTAEVFDVDEAWRYSEHFPVVVDLPNVSKGTIPPVGLAIAEACRRNVVFMALSADTNADSAVITPLELQEKRTFAVDIQGEPERMMLVRNGARVWPRLEEASHDTNHRRLLR